MVIPITPTSENSSILSHFKKKIGHSFSYEFFLGKVLGDDGGSRILEGLRWMKWMENRRMGMIVDDTLQTLHIVAVPHQANMLVNSYIAGKSGSNFWDWYFGRFFTKCGNVCHKCITKGKKIKFTLFFVEFSPLRSVPPFHNSNSCCNLNLNQNHDKNYGKQGVLNYYRLWKRP
jgi:hypothetical protein